MTAVPATPLTFRKELAEAEDQLRAQLAAIEDDRAADWLAADSALPGWTRGHVVGHLLGNLDGMLNLVEWARTGVETPMYASREAREAAIQERAGWPLDRLRGALRDGAADFAERCSALSEPVGERLVRLGSGGAAEVWELPMLRTREIQIHRVDLADTYRPGDWSAEFTLRTMGQVQPAMAARRTLPIAELRATDTGRAWVCADVGPALWGPEAQLLAWLLGRQSTGLHLNGPLTPTDVGIPEAPPWV